MNTTVGAYETIVIFKSASSEAQQTELTERLQRIAKEHQGEWVINDTWGKRKMAYPINKQDSAVYIYYSYTGNNGTVAEVERNIRNNENVMRFMTTKIDTEESGTNPDVLKKLYTEANWAERSKAKDMPESPRGPRRHSFHDDEISNDDYND